MPLPPANTLTVGAHGKSTTFTLADDTFVVNRSSDKKWPRIETTVRHVLWAELSGETMQVSFLAKRKKKSQLSLVHITGKVQHDEIELASTFTTTLMGAAYAGLKRHRRLKAFVNPKSGPGNAISHYIRRVEPIFHAARCLVDTTFTSYSGHAKEIVKELDADQFDVIVSVSGDGLSHEIINGFAEHQHPDEMFRIPIAPVPSGSGNGMALNILGLEDGYDVAAAALNAVKGRPMQIDLCSVTQGDRKMYSFMSQTVGLFADLDIGTEWLRFLGSTRFVVGYIYEVIRLKRCPIKLSMKVVETDKERMVHNLHAHQARAKAKLASESRLPGPESATTDADNASTTAPSTVGGSAFPDPKSASAPSSPNPSLPSGDGWTTFDKRLSYVYAGKGPYVSRDLMQFPVSIPDDGLIDVVAQEITTRKTMIDAMDGSEHGKQFWMPTQHYFRVQAYRVEPDSPNGCLSIDGEEYPFEAFTVECHRAMATVMSPYGYYQGDFPSPEESRPR